MLELFPESLIVLHFSTFLKHFQKQCENGPEIYTVKARLDHLLNGSEMLSVFSAVCALGRKNTTALGPLWAVTHGRSIFLYLLSQRARQR